MKCDTEKRHHKIGMNSAEASQSALEFEKNVEHFDWLIAKLVLILANQNALKEIRLGN